MGELRVEELEVWEKGNFFDGDSPPLLCTREFAMGREARRKGLLGKLNGSAREKLSPY